MAYKYPYDKEEKEKPREKLPTNRNMWKLMILNILTLGIYSIWFLNSVSHNLKKVSERGEWKQINFGLAYVLSLFTFLIVVDIWHHHTAERISEALEYRKIDYEFGTGDFWKWFIFGSFILVGPFVYFYKFCRAMNLLCEDYNERPIVMD